MNFFIKFLFLISLLGCSNLYAELRIIELADGSRLRGEIISFSNGSYTIRSESLGVIKLAASQVKNISAGQNTSASRSVDNLDSIQSSLMANSDILNTIMQLQNDPDMKAVLSDPEIMSAIQRMDFDTLSQHPKIKRLMRNQKVREIQSAVN